MAMIRGNLKAEGSLKSFSYSGPDGKLNTFLYHEEHGVAYNRRHEQGELVELRCRHYNSARHRYCKGTCHVRALDLRNYQPGKPHSCDETKSSLLAFMATEELKKQFEGLPAPDIRTVWQYEIFK